MATSVVIIILIISISNLLAFLVGGWLVWRVMQNKTPLLPSLPEINLKDDKSIINTPEREERILTQVYQKTVKEGID